MQQGGFGGEYSSERSDRSCCSVCLEVNFSGKQKTKGIASTAQVKYRMYSKNSNRVRCCCSAAGCGGIGGATQRGWRSVGGAIASYPCGPTRGDTQVQRYFTPLWEDLQGLLYKYRNLTFLTFTSKVILGTDVVRLLLCRGRAEQNPAVESRITMILIGFAAVSSIKGTQHFLNGRVKKTCQA